MTDHGPDELDTYAEALVSAHEALVNSGSTHPQHTVAQDTVDDFRLELEFLEDLELLRRYQVTVPASREATNGASKAGDSQKLGAQTLERFQIERELGRGGCGVVFLAYDPRLERRVALKVPRADVLLSREMKTRFVREGQTAAGLNHPGIIAVYEAGEATGVCYIASEYCSGPTLATWLAGLPHEVPQQLAARVVADLADAVDHAHRHGVLHRDLKPGNVLLMPVEPASAKSANFESANIASANAEFPFAAKLADFGLAKLMEDEDAGEGATRTGAFIGTPAYMSPEQANGRTREIGTHSDVYALGVILYELLARRQPFLGGSDVETLRRIVEKEPTRPSVIRRSISRDLEAICLKCLEKSPDKRYSSAMELAADLRRFLTGEPTRARPTSLPGRVWKWTGRNPTAAGFISFVVLALMVGAVGLTTYSIKQKRFNTELSAALETADRARQRAEQSEQAALSSEQAAKASELSARRMSYRTDVQRAYDFYLSNNWFDASRSLANQIPTEPQKDLRGLEWRWLDAEINAKLHRLGSHDGPATGCVVFPDGNTVATAGEDGFVRLWDAKARKMIKLIDPQLGPIHAMAISPDGETLAIAVGPSFATFGQGIVRLLKSRTGEKFGVVRFHRTTIDSVEFSPDGKLLAAGSRYDNVSLSTVEGKPLHVFPSDTYNRTCAFSPDSRELAFLADPSLLRVVDCLTGKVTTDIRLREKGTDEAAPAHAVRWSPDGQYLAVAYRYRGFLKTYDAQTGHELAVLHAHLAARPRINALEFQVDGGAIVAGDTVGQHHRWFIDLDSWRTHVRDHGEPAVVLADALPSTVDKTATNACASISSSAVVSVHDSGQVVLAAPDQTAAKVRPLPPTVTTAVPNSTDSIILGTKDGTIQAYNIKTGKYRQLTADSSERVVDLAVCEDGRVVAAAYWNGQVELVDTHSRAVKWTRPDTLEQFDINTDFFVDVSSDGNRIACTGEDDQLIVWDLISSKTLFQQELSQSGLSVRFSHSQNLLAHTAKSLTIYEVGTWKPILRKDITEIGPVAFRQDDRQLACCLPDGSMRLINLVTEEMQILHTGSSRMRDVGYSADGRTLLATGISSEVVREDGAGGLAIYLWESETGEKFGEFRHDLKAADHNRMFVVGDRVIVCTIPLRPKSDDDFKIAVWDLAP